MVVYSSLPVSLHSLVLRMLPVRNEDPADRIRAWFWDRVARHVHVHQRAAPFTGRLLDGGRHFIGLGIADADLPLAVADDDHGGEAEATAPLHHARATTDLDELIDEVGTIAIAALILAAISAATATLVVSTLSAAIVAGRTPAATLAHDRITLLFNCENLRTTEICNRSTIGSTADSN